MKYFIGFSQYGIELPDNIKSNEEKIDFYIKYMGGTQQAFDYFLRNLCFFKDNIKDIEFKEENNDTRAVL